MHNGENGSVSPTSSMIDCSRSTASSTTWPTSSSSVVASVVLSGYANSSVRSTVTCPDSGPRHREHSPVVGLRYFNVYGPRESHKGSMASVAFHLFNQVKAGENPKLFDAYGGYGPGEQRRDFVHVADVADVNLWCWKRGVSGIFNCGTGRAEPFRAVAEAVIGALGQGAIEFIPFPEHLKGRYQSFTEADLSRLRGAGYNGAFRDVATGVKEYMEWLKASS